ncbi:MAG: MauE/DoxX family redox-associated membrane protein, partial [Deltaproteobacteria bacterium]|nr:MauE/DoxX family redox-associated membrane protein [Deltaproteobacteria bacterium]
MRTRIFSFVWVLRLVLRLGLAGLFVVAGVLKLDDPSRFALEIANYQLFPVLAPFVAIGMPATEIVVGLGLVFLPKLWRQAAATLLAAMMAIFLFAVSSALVRNVNIDCGCFGGSESPIGPWTVVRNVVLLALALLVVWLERPRRTD